MLQKYKNPRLGVTQPLCVEFVGEAGVDAGGVTREFFHLLMERLKNQGVSINLFEGQVGHLVPINNYNVLPGSLFLQAGQELHASPHVEHFPILSYPYISIYGYVLSIYGYVDYHDRRLAR